MWLIPLLLLCFTQKCFTAPPNIIVIVIDDFGWNDAPWNNPDSPATYIAKHAKYAVSKYEQ